MKFSLDITNFCEHYKNAEKRQILFSNLIPIIKDEDLHLAELMGDQHLALLLWIAKDNYKKKKKKKNKIFKSFRQITTLSPKQKLDMTTLRYPNKDTRPTQGPNTITTKMTLACPDKDKLLTQD